MNEQKQSTLTSIEAYYDSLMKAASPEITMDSEIRAFLSKEGGIYKGGDDDMRAYYFYYDKNEVTTLDREFLHTVKTTAQSYVIYADRCILSEEELEKFHITFKKIPRDITKL